MLKKILITLIMLGVLIGSVSMAGAKDVKMNITFLWEQVGTDLPNLQEWRLKWSDGADGTYTPVVGADGNPIIMPYDGTPKPEYSATEPFVVVAAPGVTITKYFKLTAFGKDGIESEMSNVAINPDGSIGVDFTAPWDPVGTPVKFEVEAQVITGQ